MSITLLTLVLGYPLAFYMAHSSTSRANVLMVFVLLPFWTSLLVSNHGLDRASPDQRRRQFDPDRARPHARPARVALHAVFHDHRDDAHSPALHGAAALFGHARYRPELHARGDVHGQPAYTGLPCASTFPMSLPGLSAGALLVVHHLGRLLHHAGPRRRNRRPDDLEHHRVPHAAVEQLGAGGRARLAAAVPDCRASTGSTTGSSEPATSKLG